MQSLGGRHDGAHIHIGARAHPHSRAPLPHSVPGDVGWALSTVDLVFSCYFALYFLLRFYMAETRVRFLFSWMTLVDIVTILPAMIAYHSSSLVALSFLRILRVLRVLRLFNMTKASCVMWLVARPVVRRSCLQAGLLRFDRSAWVTGFKGRLAHVLAPCLRQLGCTATASYLVIPTRAAT
jgi:hypothetical protein